MSMWQFIVNFFKRWLKQQFAGNPLVEDTGPYLQKTGQALGVGAIGATIFILFGFIGAVFFVIGSIKQWF